MREFFETHFKNRYLERDSIFIVYVEVPEEIAQLIEYANQNGCVIVPTTGGNDLFYEISTSKMDIIVLNMSLMKKVKDFDMESGYIEVEPGITVGNLNRFFEKNNYNLFFPTMPYGSCDYTTIAGNIATKTYSKYDFFGGNIGNNLLALNVMDIKGNSFFFGSKTLKNSTGYNLKDMFLGSRGKAGIITSAILKLSLRKETTFTYFILVENDKEREIIYQFFAADKNEICYSMVYYSNSAFRGTDFADILKTTPRCGLFVIELHGFKEDIEYETNIISGFLKKNNIKFRFVSDKKYYDLQKLELDAVFLKFQRELNGIFLKTSFSAENGEELFKKINSFYDKHDELGRYIFDLNNNMLIYFMPVRNDFNNKNYEKQINNEDKVEVFRDEFISSGLLSMIGEGDVGLNGEKYLTKDFIKNSIYYDLEKDLLNSLKGETCLKQTK